MSAVFGIVGVIIGALLTGMSNYFFARRRERLAARVAARLVRDDLYLVSCWIEDAVSSGRLPSSLGAPIDTAVWKEQRLHIATVTSYKDYSAVVQAILAIGRLNNWLVISKEQSTISDPDKEQLKQWLGDLAGGLGVLKSLAQ